MPLRMMVACLVVATTLAGGQLLFKMAALDIAGKWALSPLQALLSPWLVSALLLYGAATALWVWVLVHVPLSPDYAPRAGGRGSSF